MTAAVVAAGLGASVAQTVYSVNSVGYVNKTLVPGYNLISSPLNATNSSLDTVLPVVPDGTVILKWDSALQTFAEANQYYEGIPGWFPSGTVTPGEGFFINIPGVSSVTVTFVGEVPQGSLTNRIAGNYSLIAQIVPQSISLTAPGVGFPPQDGDIYLPWSAALQTFGDSSQYYEGIPGFFPYDPTPAVAEGFFYNTGPAAGRNWTRTFSVN